MFVALLLVQNVPPYMPIWFMIHFLRRKQMVAFVKTPVVLSVYAYYKCMLTTFVPPWHNQSTELFSLVILGLQVHLPSPRDPFKYFET